MDQYATELTNEISLMFIKENSCRKELLRNLPKLKTWFEDNEEGFFLLSILLRSSICIQQIYQNF